LCVLNVTVDTVTVARIPDEAAIETRFKNLTISKVIVIIS